MNHQQTQSAECEARSAPPQCSAMNQWERARQEQQYWMLAQSAQVQEERIAAHYTTFVHLAMQLRELVVARKHSGSPELNETIRYLTGKIREGHLMEFGIELEWPKMETGLNLLHPLKLSGLPITTTETSPNN